MRRAGILAAITAILLSACGMAMASGTQPEPNTNQVSYWCAAGFKYEPVSTPYQIPDPPTGFVWSLLVLKAGDENSTPVVNETYANPQPGDFYSRADGKNISHVILCVEPEDTTTSSSSTTTSSTTTTSTTLPPCPDCTPNTVVTIPPPGDDGTTTTTTTTVPGQTTTTTVPGQTTTTTVPGQTTTTSPPLPITE